jgi:hypothetical protein
MPLHPQVIVASVSINNTKDTLFGITDLIGTRQTGQSLYVVIQRNCHCTLFRRDASKFPLPIFGGSVLQEGASPRKIGGPGNCSGGDKENLCFNGRLDTTFSVGIRLLLPNPREPRSGAVILKGHGGIDHLGVFVHLPASSRY